MLDFVKRLIPMFLVLAPGLLFGANLADERLLGGARESFRAGFYARADAEFGEFVLKFPTNSEVSEAVLLQAQARVLITNYDGAVSLLTGKLPQAGTLSDQYLFWLGEAMHRKGDHQQAAQYFGRVSREFPGSSRGIESALGEADSRAKLGEWAKVETLLEATNGVFQTTLQSNPTNQFAVRGLLLLAEARFSQQDYAGSEAAIQATTRLSLEPRMEWQRQYLLCRIRLAQKRLEEALQGTTNLLAITTNIDQRRFFADAIFLRAGIQESLGRLDQAASTLREVLTPAFSAERQRQAVLKIAELSILANLTADAAAMMERYLAQFPQASAADLAWLSLGEIRLRQHLAGPTNRLESVLLVPPGNTNAFVSLLPLQAATETFQRLTNDFPKSPLLGKANLNLGWCFALDQKLEPSRKALEIAVATLPKSEDQATALFKLADVRYQLRDYAGALTNYTLLIDQYGSVPQVRTNYVEQALYQGVRSAWSSGNAVMATNLLAKLLVWFPNSFQADRAVLISGQELGRTQNLIGARQLLENFLTQSPAAELVPEVQLAVARTLEQEQKWPEAIEHYDRWLSVNTNHSAVPRAEYFRAWAHFQAGHETNSFRLFTNFVARFPTNEFTPLARWWIADYCFRQGGPSLVEAEKHYQLLSQNLPVSEISYQARLMAGRVALARQGWDDARTYFTALWNDTNAPGNLRVQSLYAYGDTLMSMDSPETNKLANYEEAIRVFSRITELYPSNGIAALAWGQKANCLLQYVQTASQQEALSNACHSFQVVMDSPGASVGTRSTAKVGLALALEKQAALRPAAEQASVLRQARDHLLDVLYGKILHDNETGDAFWVRKAGIEAGRISEALQEWNQAIAVYEKLVQLLPPLRARFEKNIARAREQLARDKS